jgi:hypothetical protein
MRWVLNKYVVFAVLLAFVWHVLPVHAAPGGGFVVGKKSADEAASWQHEGTVASEGVPSLRYAVPMSHSFAQPDSTEFEFPEKENKHLARDITIFVIVSAFVAYFLIKVFLEGDKDEPDGGDDGNGKEPPPL